MFEYGHIIRRKQRLIKRRELYLLLRAGNDLVMNTIYFNFYIVVYFRGWGGDKVEKEVHLVKGDPYLYNWGMLEEEEGSLLN